MPTAIKNSIIDISLEKTTKELARNFSNYLKGGEVIFLYGEIGVGKTTFARLLINSFESEKKIKKSEVLSPTFNIVFEYEIKEFTIKHFDLYRLKNDNDIKNVGLYENLEQSITLIEWPELIKNKPKNLIELFFSYEQDYNKRSLVISADSRKEIFDKFKL